ncbi:prefoldin subunit 3 [Verticillium alfalfae VaMs.102]|uniref:Prefoldin subunit 3 n=1 Tax=Verticillium alfalfae (strain VaMs.102 / ATCC MYA-4576 / FGSC 10136) TaxID=526221 RepID=C9SGJ9_VERA1|nr:prefoldin subunit 3 [Verticillium alfalfae VaMs.102]EEY17516.1 prefoldin subunit 3 [Verticillium alfalfae VaMs.102]
MASQQQDATPSNPRGIPTAPFVDKVEDYVSTRADVEPTLRNFQEMISKYQFMELNLQKRMGGLNDKIPDIQKTLDSVRFLKLRKANVMLAYEIDEAEALLESKLSTAKLSLSNCEEDLDFLREQITTMEVAIARGVQLGKSSRREKTRETKKRSQRRKGKERMESLAPGLKNLTTTYIIPSHLMTKLAPISAE